MSHWSGLRFLASATLWILGPQWNSFWIACYCLVSWRSQSIGSVDPIPSHVLAVHRWGKCWDESAYSSGSGSGLSGSVSPPAFPYCHYLTHLSSTDLSSSPNAAGRKSRASFALKPSGLSHLQPHHEGQLYFYPGEVQGQLSCVLQLVKSRASCPTPVTPGPALPPATYIQIVLILGYDK